MTGEFIGQLTGFVSHPRCVGTPLRARVFRGSGTNSNVGIILVLPLSMDLGLVFASKFFFSQTTIYRQWQYEFCHMYRY